MCPKNEQQQKVPETNKHYSKVERRLIYKLITFLYGIMKPFEFKIKNVIPFILASPKDKYLGINVTEYVQDLFEEN